MNAGNRVSWGRVSAGRWFPATSWPRWQHVSPRPRVDPALHSETRALPQNRAHSGGTERHARRAAARPATSFAPMIGHRLLWARRHRWPLPLRTLVGVMLRSRQPMALAWGPERTLLYNDGYIPVLGQRHPHALGRPFLDVWHELSEDIGPCSGPRLRRRGGLARGPAAHPAPEGLSPKPPTSPSPTRPSTTRPERVAGMFCACTETTGRVLFARRQAFRVELESRLRGLADPGALAATATRMLGPWLRAARVFYIEVDPRRRARHRHPELGTSRACADLMGRRFRLDDLGPALVRDVLSGPGGRHRGPGGGPAHPRRGRANLRRDAGPPPSIAVPVVAGRPDGGRAGGAARRARADWSPEEVDVACEVAGRTRHAAERSRTARALRASEARFRALVDASAQIVWTTDAAGRAVEDSPVVARVHRPGPGGMAGAALARG